MGSYEPRCRPWFILAMANINRTSYLEPYIDFYSGSIVSSFVKSYSIYSQFLKQTVLSVTAIDLDLSIANYRGILDEFQGFDHYYLIDTKLNVVMHSFAPFILRENVNVTQIEFMVTEAQ